MSAFDEYHDLAARLMGRDDFPLPLPEWDRNYPHNVGLLSDAEESELTALVMKHTRGITFVDWKQLDLEQRLPWVRLAVEDADSAAAASRKVSIRASLIDRAKAGSKIVESDEVAGWPMGLLDELIADGTLTAIENTKSVTCLECGHDHIENVEYIESPPRSGLRAYIACPTAGRVSVPLDRLRRWSIKSNTVPSDGKRHTNPQSLDEPLSSRAQDVLVAMIESSAIDSDHRLTTEEISAKAVGEHADANALKGVMSELNTREYVQSKTGRGGGIWLSEKGRTRAERLRNG